MEINAKCVKIAFLIIIIVITFIPRTALWIRTNKMRIK